MYNPPVENAGKQYALAIFLSILPTVFTYLRFYARYSRKNEILLDDWLIIVALLGTYVASLLLIIGTAAGYQGRHMKFTSDGLPIIADPKYVMFLKTMYVGQLGQIFAIGPGKLSVLFLYRRIFRGAWFNLITWALIGLVSAWIVAFFFANMLVCLPVTEAFVNAPGIGRNPRCIDAVPMYLSQVYSDLVLDVLILAVPIPSVWNLQMPIKQKVAVSGIFLLGIITTASSAAKLIIFDFVGQSLAKQPDVSYLLTPIAYWPVVEASLQIVTACLPMLRHVFQDALRGAIAFTSLNSIKQSRSGYIKDNDGSESGMRMVRAERESGRGDGRPHALQFKNSSMKIEHFPLPQGGATVTEAPLQGIWVERAFGAQVQEDVEPGRWM